MTFIFLIFLSTFSAQAFAACPNISGTYFITNSGLMKLEQNACAQIVKTLGNRESDGQIIWQAGKTFMLDGTPICDVKNHCEAVFGGTLDSIRFANNFGEIIYVPGHGRCAQDYYFATNDKYKNLAAKYFVKNCPDGYSGNFFKTYHRM
ncbi:MAG: hypothetical protein ACXWQO_18790 [Bdellovibrionota bacterium]